MKLCKCPHCKGLLNPGGRIILLGASVDNHELPGVDLDEGPPESFGGMDYVLFSFEPQPGDYSYRVDKNVEIRKGDRWVFSCPLCRKDLTSRFSNDLANVLSSDEVGKEHILVFSKLAGEHATFDVSESGIQGFGEHHQKYVVINIQRHYW